MIAMKLETAAESLDMEPAAFISAVKKGDLPEPIFLGGMMRWSVSDLEYRIGLKDRCLPSLIEDITG